MGQATNPVVPVVPIRVGANQEQRQAFLLLRLLTGLDFFGHGFARIFTGTHLSGFAQGMVKNMAGTMLPASVAKGTGYVVPCVEFLIGVLLLLGVATRFALTLALLLMLVLMFGITLKQDWSTAGTQLGYGFVLAALLFGRERYDLSWPAFFRSLTAS
jgi:thiosulfate dehydrogenase [quinone] large subunit